MPMLSVYLVERTNTCSLIYFTMFRELHTASSEGADVNEELGRLWKEAAVA